jgi:hypothetical protein
MARPSNQINEAIEEAVQAVVARILPAINRAINESVEARIRAESRPAGRDRHRARVARPSARTEMTRWVADNRARRVPTFVIEATGLETKKKIVAKYGANAAFAKGKPLPPVAFEAVKAVKFKAEARTEREVKAKPPVVRKAAAR